MDMDAYDIIAKPQPSSKVRIFLRVMPPDPLRQNKFARLPAKLKVRTH